MGDAKFRQTGRRTRKGPYRTETQERKRLEGEVRNEAWRELTKGQKIVSLTSRRGSSTKQLKKLERQ